MKTWITYISALLMGLATALLFGSYPYSAGIFSSVSSYLISLGIFIAIPVIIVTFSAGTASLMKDAKGHRVVVASILWTIVSTLIFSFIAAVVFIIKPVSFPVTSSAGSAPGTLINHVSYMLNSSISALYPINALWTITTATRFIVPVIIVSWILGLALKPSADIIRPAYTIMNSFSEVMYRISRTYSVYGFFLVYVASSSLFIGIYQEKTIFTVPEYAKQIALGICAIVLIILPLLYAIFTGFRKNPYKVIYRSIAPAIMGLSTANIITSLPLLESIARYDLGAQKRISSTAGPLLTIIGKGGSAFISVLSLLALYQATTETMPTGTVIATTAGAVALISFISSAAIGSEAMLISVLTLNLLGINLYGAENALIAFMPIICGLGSMLDALIVSCGNSIASVFVGTDTEVPYRDTL